MNLTPYPFLRKMSKPRFGFVGREKELEFLEEQQYKRRMNNIILVGTSGCGKTSLVQQFAYKNKDTYAVYEFDTSLALTNTKYRGEYEEKIRKALQELTKSDKQVILFIDEIHTICVSGCNEECLSLGDILKPLLSEGKIRVIGATTPEEYSSTICRDKALSRRFRSYSLRELTKSESARVLLKFWGKGASSSAISYILDYVWGDVCGVECGDVREFTSGISRLDLALEILDSCLARSLYKQVPITVDLIDEVIENHNFL